MSHCLTPVAPGDAAVVWVSMMEDGHLHWSPSTCWEWDSFPGDSGCLHKGGLDWKMARAYWDWVCKAEVAVQFLIWIANLQPLFTEVQLALNSHKFLHDLHDSPLGVLHQHLQCILEVAQAPVAVNFPMILAVINLGKCHIDGKLLLIPCLKCRHLTGFM